MSTKKFDPLNPLDHIDKQNKVEKQLEKIKSTEERINDILNGEQPTDTMSWEYYIWMKHKDPFYKR